MAFTHFHVHSQYSILDGAASVPGLVEKAIADGMTAISLTDHGNMFGIKLFYDTCRKKGIKPILGVEAYVARESLYSKEKPVDRSGEHLIILAKNLKGYLNLVKLCSTAFVDGYYYRPRIDKALLEKYHEGLIISSACLGGEICQKIMGYRGGGGGCLVVQEFGGGGLLLGGDEASRRIGEGEGGGLR